MDNKCNWIAVNSASTTFSNSAAGVKDGKVDVGWMIVKLPEDGVPGDLIAIGIADENIAFLTAAPALYSACKDAVAALEYAGVSKPVIFKDDVLLNILKRAICAAEQDVV